MGEVTGDATIVCDLKLSESRATHVMKAFNFFRSNLQQSDQSRKKSAEIAPFVTFSYFFFFFAGVSTVSSAGGGRFDAYTQLFDPAGSRRVFVPNPSGASGYHFSTSRGV